MFPVAHAHCILTTTFAHSFFFFNDVCIYKSLKCRKICHKMIFWSKHAEGITSVYLLNQIFEFISDLQISKWIWPLPISLFVCISSWSIDKKIAHCCFSVDKITNKRRIMHSSFGCTTGNILIIFLAWSCFTVLKWLKIFHMCIDTRYLVWNSSVPGDVYEIYIFISQSWIP